MIGTENTKATVPISTVNTDACQSHPANRIRDYGSLNGTWINDFLIGQRDESESAEEAVEHAKVNYTDHDLSHGDRLKLGNTAFEVPIDRPIVCCDCQQEIAEGDQRSVEGQSRLFRCAECRDVVYSAIALTVPQPPRKPQPRCCCRCGRAVAEESGADRPGEYICEACRNEPSKVLQQLLDKAQTASRDLVAIRGYTLQKELGRGGMGAVYLARHDESDQDVALKAADRFPSRCRVSSGPRECAMSREYDRPAER